MTTYIYLSYSILSHPIPSYVCILYILYIRTLDVLKQDTPKKTKSPAASSFRWFELSASAALEVSSQGCSQSRRFVNANRANQGSCFGTHWEPSLSFSRLCNRMQSYHWNLLEPVKIVRVAMSHLLQGRLLLRGLSCSCLNFCGIYDSVPLSFQELFHVGSALFTTAFGASASLARHLPSDLYPVLTPVIITIMTHQDT